MKKLNIGSLPWVVFDDDSFKDCNITLVHQWTAVDGDMGIVVVQPKTPDDTPPFTKTVNLKELNFMAFRGRYNENS